MRAFADWADCMRSKGFDRTRPVKDPKAHKLGAHQTSEEIAEAVADVACKQRTNLVGVWFTTESTYQKGMIQQHAAELAAIKQNNATIVQAATQVVASG